LGKNYKDKNRTLAKSQAIHTVDPHPLPAFSENPEIDLFSIRS
jgi:hypothetical protein